MTTPTRTYALYVVRRRGLVSRVQQQVARLAWAVWVRWDRALAAIGDRRDYTGQEVRLVRVPPGRRSAVPIGAVGTAAECWGPWWRRRHAIDFVQDGLTRAMVDVALRRRGRYVRPVRPT